MSRTRIVGSVSERSLTRAEPVELVNATVNAGNFVTEPIDMLGFRHLCIYGKAASSTALHFAVSPTEAGTYYVSTYTFEGQTIGSDYHLSMEYTNVPTRYVKIYVRLSATDLNLFYVRSK